MPDIDAGVEESRIQIKDIFFEEDDLPYEEDILRNAFSIKCWFRYIEHKQRLKAPNKQINLIYERALKELPGSYKLWYQYLKLRRRQAKPKCITDPIYEEVNNCFERALVFMHKMPRIWMDYCQFLIKQAFIIRTRKTFDRALRALPITQHGRLWPMYLDFVSKHNVPETSIRVYRRYLKVRIWIDYCQFLIKQAFITRTRKTFDRALRALPITQHGRLWPMYLDFVSKHNVPETSIRVYRRYLKVRIWIDYCQFLIKQAFITRTRKTFDRALRALPITQHGRLWPMYLDFVSKHNVPETSIRVYRRYLKVRIWIDYCQFLIKQAFITRTRKTFDRALRALPITQHGRLWPMYLDFVSKHNVPETSIRVYRRYLKLCPENREDYIEFLKNTDQLDEAAQQLTKTINDERFVSKEGKSKYQLWQELCDLTSKNPQKVHSVRVEAMIRQGIKRYTDQVGQLWGALADYFIRARHFEKARDVYEEAIQTVTTVRDFTQVFDAYAQFEERIAGSMMEDAAKKPGGPSAEEDLEIELRLARFESLMDRRPLLLNSVLLRQNPHNVHEWHKRVTLYEGRPDKQIATFTEAVQTVEPKSQTGRLYTLWVAFAKFYEVNKQLNDARVIFEKALQVPYPKVDDLASVWCEYAELELRHNDPEKAIKLMKRATAPPPRQTHYFDEGEPVQYRVHKSLKVWSMYADLEESFGTFESCKAVYDRIIDLKIATPQIIINYGVFLEENKYFEEAFKAYEKGIALFKWPNVFDMWNTYLVKFIKRYGGKKLERARDLFEQCLDGCPPEFAKSLYLMYAKLEEEHGLARHAMSNYNRATKHVAEEEKLDVYNIYLKKAAELYGVTHTRPIYEDAIENLPEDASRAMCLRYAELERKLGEIDRARAVYSHCSQMCDPRVHAHFWEVWKEFEVRHGNEDTVREMLRIKRSVQATYNTQVNFMSAQMLAAAGANPEQTAQNLGAGDSMALLEAKAAQMAEEERASTSAVAGVSGGVKAAGGISFVRGGDTANTKNVVQATNPDEIDLGEDEEDEDEDDDEEEEEMDTGDDGEQPRTSKKKKKDEIQVEEQTVPSEVYGSLAPADD